MNAPLTPALLLDAIRRAKKQRAAEASLYEFVVQAWPVMEPGIPFIPSWHIQIICEHLEAVHDGDIRRLLINIPPRHSKSTIVSVAFPCWEWIHSPQEKFLCASYSGNLAIRDNLKARRLVQSNWYQERWGSVFQLAGDQSAKQRFENDKTGYRIATSVGGTATGEGGSRLILDDGISTQDAQSDAVRGTTLEWLDMAWSTRLNNPKRDAMIEVAQRSHEDDPSGHRLKQGGWEHVCIPAEFDGVKRSTSIFVDGYDPRSSIGQLICPDRFGPVELDDLKKQLGEYGTAGQLQQRPAPPGGGIIKTKHFQLWLKKWDLPAFDQIVQSYDGAYDDKSDSKNDPTACTVWGLFEERGIKGALLLDSWDEHLGAPAFRKKVLEGWKEVYGKSDKRRGKKADTILMENKSSGISILQDLRAANIPAVPYNPGSLSKKQRAHSVAPVHELDIIYIPESSKEPGEFVTWARPFVDQCGKFPNAEHDDYVDTYTQFLTFGRDSGFFEMPFVEHDPVEELDYNALKKMKRNPYAA